MLKKAVSPMIATVLLVAFAVALGVAVMNFTSNTATELTQETDKRIETGIKCSLDLSLSIVELYDEKYICYNRSGSNNLETIIENQGGIEAAGVQFFLMDINDDPYTFNNITPIPAHGRTKFNISLGDTFGFPPTKILISPILKASGSTIEVCTNNRIDLEEIRKC